VARVELKGVSKKWGGTVAVDHVDLVIGDQEFVVFLGPSGCGKTTTMRMIAGLEDPSAGDILINGRIVNDLEPKDRDIAMVFQNYGLYPNLTVYENIRFPLRVRGTNPAQQREKVMRAAEMVELGDLLDRRPRALSGGQRQRVALARAIVRQPAVFLMDEPLSNLDAKLRVSTRAQIKNLQHELKVTTIYVTHDQVEAMTLAHRVVVMNKGQIQQIGTPKDIYNKPINTFVAGFIGSPPMNLIGGEVSNGVFESGSARVSGLPPFLAGKITLGFRAEDASVQINVKGNFAGPAYTVELLGDATLVSLRMGPSILTVKAPKDFPANIGDQVSFHIKPGNCHFFDPAIGNRIETTEPNLQTG
jgi:multiple sugar transport system ATP-binding protein